MIITRITIDGDSFDDYQELRVQKAISDYNSSSSFSIKYDSPFGRHKTDFSIGQEVAIYSGEDIDDGLPSQESVIADPLDDFNGIKRLSQTFLMGSTNRIIAGVQLILDQDSSPNVGRVIASIFNVDQDKKPTGISLVSGSFKGAELGIYPNYSTITIIFDNTIELSSNTRYALVLKAPDQDVSVVEWYGSNTNPLTDEKSWKSNDNGLTWTENTSLDQQFKFLGLVNILTGVIEKIQFDGEENYQTITLSGRDYSLRLQDTTVDPIVYTNSEISTIIKDIITDNVSNITTKNVDVTTTTLPRISFNHATVFEAFQQLAELSGFFFYVDHNKDLHFEERENASSGIILDNTNINTATLLTTREGMANDIYVYGGRALAGFEETFTADGTGSVFTLLSKPRNTYVEVNNQPQKGGVFELTTTPTSGPRYLISYHDRLVIFVSGTTIGYSSIPQNGSSVVILYDRDIPIVKAGTDRTSISLYGKKTKIINDKSIEDPNTALNILKKELEKSNPFKGFECTIEGWYNLTPGQTARVTLNDFNIDEDIGILSVDYNFNKETIHSKQIITIRLDRKIKDITDEITDIRKRLSMVESADKQQSDIITRLEQAVGEFSVVGSYWTVSSNEIVGSLSHIFSTDFIPPSKTFRLAPAFPGSIINTDSYTWQLGSGTLGSSLNLTGTTHTYMEVENNIDLMPATGLSVAFWFNLHSVEQTNSFPRIVNKEGNTPRNGWTVNWNSGTISQAIRMQIISGGTIQGTGDITNSLIPGGVWQSGIWYHFAGTYSSGGTRNAIGYLNGTKLISGTVTQNIGSNELPMRVGQPSAATNAPWRGLIDDIRIWNKALTEGEIGSIYRNTITPTTNLITHYMLNEGVGSIAENFHQGNLAGSFTGSAVSFTSLSIQKSGGFYS